MNINEVVKRMNRAGELGDPFLFVFDFEMEKALFIEKPTFGKTILFKTPAYQNLFVNTSPADKVLSPMEVISFISSQEYNRGFNIVQNGIMRGDSYLLNYTVRSEVNFDGSLESIFYGTSSPYGICVPDEFVCFSPERFVRIAGGKIYSNPMKGTADASIPGAEENLKNSYKESCEHNTIVDLIRNDIGMVANNVIVERFKYTQKIESDRRSIFQMSSEISGDITPEYKSRYGDIFRTILPAGSVSGAPKESTLKIIREAEVLKRGYYTGVFGYFDGKELDSAVMIRFIEKKGDRLFYRSGGGITINSNPAEERDEAFKKIYLPINNG